MAREPHSPDGRETAPLGQGTWGMGQRDAERAAEVAALRHGLDLGLTLIDTAEMYADGGAESVVGEAVAGRRDEVFLVDKVLPHHADRRGTVQACERSLRRLGTDHIDLYLLHWRGATPLAETVDAFLRLRDRGLIGAFGVSNLDVSDLEELWLVDGGPECAVNQVLYNLTRRGIELDLLPWCRERGLRVMAYSPIEQGRLLEDPVLTGVAGRHGVLPAQVALAWVLRGGELLAVAKAAALEHVSANRGALDIRLTRQDLAELDARFPAPDRPVPLEVL
ncbi:aldo/keto reductase [Actinoalloteichus caeruleus]|uniref:Aldo/keto reductase n=1 Tax=Actinoalloteichus caeruleus DSM 43889 TaxID=1120930 RepID=A0ABT1JEF5_ACTCY|nr:aldo/keto reductase [Actinoalloteichus caeruleus]MCP2330872.1 Aldo/keto reductase [Actinoalloteichus caeruleus DSM 43889]